MKVILLILIINFILFLPRYLFRLPKKWNPFDFIVNNDSLKEKVKSIYFSRIIDPFRISMEYTIPILLVLLLGIYNHSLIYCFVIIALLIFSFNVYAGIFMNILHRTPILKSDVLFLRDSLSIYKGYFLLITFSVLLLLAVLGYLFFYLTNLLFTFEFNKIVGLGLLLFILANGLLNIQYYDVKDYLARTVFSLLVFLKKSNAQSKKYESLFNLTKEDISSLNLFSKVKLKTKPNIHFISMESYGSILFKDKENYSEIRANLNNWKTKFEASDIKVCSSYATPPLFATGTWYSYSTLLFGMTIDNAAMYTMLFSDMQNFHTYESLFQFTKREGYSNYLLQGMTGEFGGTLDFDKLKRNLNYDHLLYNTDLEYNGQLLKFINLQNCVPDQFTFNKGLDIANKSNNPYTFFWCTLNSHYDFNSPHEIVPNWQDLSDENFKFQTTMEGKLNKQQRYEIAMNYTIDAIFDTIFKRTGPNDIYIVYGDHQPTMIADEKYGLETPMHIFSRDPKFVEEWKQFGFNDGLIPDFRENGDYLKFKAFYSAFMKCINKVYGEDVELEVPFMVDGVRLE